MVDGELPLSPYRVLDLTVENGHQCGRVLADFGADVIKVEPPGGDPARRRGPFYQHVEDPERSFNFWFHNLNKRGITLDLASPDGKELFQRLARRVDVLIESFPPGYMESVGLGPSALERLNPGLIVTSLTGFGQSGPHADYLAPDIVVQALGGLMYVTGDVHRPPLRITPPQAYAHGAMEAAVGTMHALFYKGNSGEGQRVDTSAQQAVVWSLMNATGMWDLNRVNVIREGALRGGTVYTVKQRLNWPCKDGYITCTIAGSQAAATGGSTSNLIQWMIDEGTAPEFLRYYDFAGTDWVNMPQEEYDFIVGPFGDFFQSKTKKELFEGALERRILLYPVATMTDHPQNRQLNARGFFVKVFHPTLGVDITYPGPAAVLGGQRLPVRLRPPLIGEHNREVYCDELGISAERLAELEQRGVL